MRASWVVLVVGIVVGACGGAGGSAGGPKPAAPAAGEGEEAEEAKKPLTPERKAYCDGYRACARETAFYEKQAELPEGAEVPEEEVDEVARQQVELCESIVADLTPEQFAWLDSCTGCGGSCHVYRCLNEIPDKPEPYECDIGGMDPTAGEGEGEE